MVRVHNVEDFVRQNDVHLRRFFVYKTGIHEQDKINETLQEFYKKLMTSRALETYEEHRGTFDAYICTLFCWLLRYMRDKNVPGRRDKNGDLISRRVMISEVRPTKDSSFVNVYDMLGDFDGIFRVNPDYTAQHVSHETDGMVNVYLNDFVRYIRITEKPVNAKRMIVYIQQSSIGCKSLDIANMLNVPMATLALLRKRLLIKYKKWMNSDAR